MLDDVGFPDLRVCQYCGEEEVLDLVEVWCVKDWGWVFAEVADECR